MKRWLSFINVRPGEERITALMTGLMLCAAAGGALGGNATEALFFARFGVDLLPAMYIALGLFTLVTALLVTALMGRISRQHLYGALPFLLGCLLVGEWLVVLLWNVHWFYALMWLGMNLIFTLQGLLTWGLAGALVDTRQAKRLFPLFSAGSILGTVIGGLLTPPLASWLHSEHLLLVWAGSMFACFALCRVLVRRSAALQGAPSEPRAQVIQEMQRGFQTVRRSAIMRWISYSAILFSVCFFSLALPFSRGAATQYPDADQLAGFLGLFQSLHTFAALLFSLLLANRLFARFGILPMLLLFPLIYLAGFAILALVAPFGALVAIRFAQMAYMNGIANPAWQAVYNVVPPEQRDQVRTFVGGVPEQTGTFLAGLILLVGERALQPRQLYLVGLGAAALLVYFLWRASRSYSQALLDALRTGQPQIFIADDRPFGSPSLDAVAVTALLRGLADPEVAVRRVSAEIAGYLPAPEITQALVRALSDPDTAVRTAALKGLGRAEAAFAIPDVSAALADPEPEVRLQAIAALGLLAAGVSRTLARVEPLLRDPDHSVRIQAAAALLRAEGNPLARNLLHALAMDAIPPLRAQALLALGDCRDATAFDLTVLAMDAPQPLVRQAAARALVNMNPGRSFHPLLNHLGDDDGSVRTAVAGALGSLGEAALEPLVAALAEPACEEGALLALAALPVQRVAEPIRAHARQAAQAALRYQRLALAAARLAGQGLAKQKYHLLEESLHAEAQTRAAHALRALGLVTTRESIAVALESLSSPRAAQRANALEILESLGERELIRPLLAIWEEGGPVPANLPDDWLLDLLADPLPWIRACAALAVGSAQEHALAEKLKALSCCDPDEWVRATAQHYFLGEPAMDTLPTLSLMERILFLRQVPLFAGLPPADLKQVSAITSEVLFQDGQALAYQGDASAEMYVILSGEVRVMVRFGSEAGEREVARRRTGDYVGEMAIISQEPRMATLLARGDVRALVLKQKHFEGILRERPEISLAMLRTLSQRLKEASSQAALKE